MRLTRADSTQARAAAEHYASLWGADAPDGCAWWIVDGFAVNGYCAARITPDGGTVRLEAAYVSPGLRGHGLQRRMIRVRCRFGRERGAARAYTYTWAGNVRSQRSLIREGFMPARSIFDSEKKRWQIYEKELA